MMNSERLVLAAENMLEDIEVQQKLQSKIYDEKMSTSDGRRMENVDTYDVDGARGDRGVDVKGKINEVLMEDLKAIIKELEEQEKELQFDHFDSQDALKIGMALIEEAKNRSNKICLDIQIAGRRLFHYSSDGNAASNDVMIERKKNTSMYTGHSSLWAHYMLKSMGMSIDEKWHLDPSQYAEVGGAFPIRLRNCPTAIGTITVSGFAHTIDHGIIIDVLREII